MRILLLGANGMLGHALQRVCKSDDVVAWDREDLDITDHDDVGKRLQEAAPDVVINTAAYTNVEQAEEDEARATIINGDAVGFLGETCKRLGIPLAHISTDYVFGGNNEHGYTEDIAPEHPLNVYGRSKLRGETLLKASTDAHWLIRTAWLYGEDGSNFVETMLRLGRDKREVRVVDDQHGSPTYTIDLAQAIRALLADNAPYGTYHLTNNGVTTWAAFARDIFSLAALDVHVVPVASADFPTKAVRPKWSILHNTKRPALPNWQEALRRYMNNRKP